MSEVAERASEMWDNAYEQGERYYRQGTDVVRNMESTTIGALLIAGDRPPVGGPVGMLV